MDWLSNNEAQIDCEQKRVKIRVQNEKEVVFKDTKKEVPNIQDIPVVNELEDVFPENLPGLPPDQEIEFAIELVPGATPVSKAPYRLAPVEMKALASQLLTLYVMSSALSLRSILDAHKLTGPNYADWLRNLRIVLRIEKLEYVIDSPKPTEPASDAHNDEHVVYRKWIDDANVAQYIMLASMNIELQKQHEHMDAHTILMHLQELYDVAGRTARYEISKELFGCRMSEGSSVNDHVLKMINLIERLGQLGFAMDGELSQDLVCNRFRVRSRSSNPKKRKRNSSKKKKVGEEKPVPPKAEDSKSKVVCFHCNKVGHWKRNCKVYLAELKKKKGSGTTASDSVTACGSQICNLLQGPRRSRTLEEEESPFSRHGERAANLLGMTCYLLGKSLSLKETVGAKFELDEVQEAQTTTDQVETPVLTKQPFVEQPIYRSGRVSRQPERYYGLVIENDNELSIIDDDDPVTYNEAMSSVDSEKWHSAMKSGKKSMYTGYKRMIRADGQVETFKARLVAKEFKQRQWIDFDETFYL
ncbi:hypothetical protein AgCh_011991 [Apium graveolens]